MEQGKKDNVVGRTFKMAAQGKPLYYFSCLSAVAVMLTGIVPYLSVYFITKQILMPAMESSSEEVVVFWAAVAGISILLNMHHRFWMLQNESADWNL